MKRMWSSLLSALGLTSGPAAGLIPAAEFTREFAWRLGDKVPQNSVEIVQDLQLSYQDGAGKQHTVFLANAYAEYRLAPARKDAVIERYLLALLESTVIPPKIDRNRIVPIIKDRTWLQEIRAALKERGAKDVKENVFEVYNDDLVILYAEDSPKSIRYLTPEDLKGLEIRLEELKELALNNLKGLLTKIEIKTGPLVSMVVADGNYEASLLLFEKMWTAGQFKVEGEIVVAIPARDLLFVSGSNSPQGIARLRDLAAKIVKQSPYHLTHALFVFRNGKFERFAEN